MSDFGKNLRQIRGDRSQKDFAATLGLPQQTYANYENGVREPKLDGLIRIAAIVGKTTDELLGVAKSDAKTHANKVADLKKAIITLLKEY